MSKTLTLLMLLFISTSIYSQEVLVPKDLKLEVTADYKAAEPYVSNSIDWLQGTPVSNKSKKRKQVNTFVLQWISGSPSVSVEIVEGLYPAGNPDCLMAFMAGWVQHSLENNYSKDKIQCATAGVEHTIEFYEKNKSVFGKNTDMEKLKKQNKKGKLKEYVASKFDEAGSK